MEQSMQKALRFLLRFLFSIPALLLTGLGLVVLGVFGSGAVAVGMYYLVLGIFASLVSYRLTIAPYLRSGTESIAAETASLPMLEERVEAVVYPSVPLPAVNVDNRSLVQFSDPNVPANLPVVGYVTSSDASESERQAGSHGALARALEEQAHQSHVLLSTDALRYFISSVPPGMVPAELLSSVITSAKQRFPSEDGWVVVSESRMREVCILCLSPITSPGSSSLYIPTIVPAGAGSLAEMIASGNLGAAFALIGHRPMFALADAVADFDALYRSRQGQATTTSTLLKEVTAELPTETIKAITVALTSALDGTYTDEAEAVKTAIMKAVKVVG